ncbi:MAG: hypothetical protein DRP08_06150, partial [Candidatus Aenigmatarchaeota archaeon]
MAKNIELHLHPFLGKKNNIEDVIEAMDDTKLDIVAIEALDHTLHNQVIEEIKSKYPEAYSDDYGTMLPDGKCILRAREYNTKETVHVLTVGYTLDSANPTTEIREIIDKCLEKDALVIIDHPFVDNAKTRTAGHISKELEEEITRLCKEYSGQITLEWNGYSIPWIRKGLKYMLKLLGHTVLYHDINEKAEELSSALKSEGCNVPVIADTDLHARKKKHLQYMGTSRIVSD